MAKAEFQCLKCARFASTPIRRRCGQGGDHEWDPLLPPTELQRRADVVAKTVSCPECREPAGAPCRSRGPRTRLVRTHVLRRCAVQAELGLIGPDEQVA